MKTHKGGFLLCIKKNISGVYVLGLGKRIQKARRSSGFTQEGIAEALNVSRNTVANWENDVKEPTLTHLADIAVLTGVSCDFLLNLPKQSNFEEHLLSENAVRLLKELINEIS